MKQVDASAREVVLTLQVIHTSLTEGIFFDTIFFQELNESSMTHMKYSNTYAFFFHCSAKCMFESTRKI